VNDKDLSQQAKEYFAQIRKTDRLIHRLDSTIATLRSSLTSTGSQLKQDKVQTSGPKNTLEETITKIIDLEADINSRIDELVQQKADAISKIRNISDHDQQNILIARYVEGDKWERIAVDLNFSIAQVYRIHGAALLDFAEKNPDILKDDSK
jgi:predicted  nucleic acid-binding Zn-ribbon protein